MSATYQIVDEPRPSGISHLVVNPVWPFFAVMFVGAWFAWPWFILNGFALGSPNRNKEVLIALGGAVGGAILGIVVFMVVGALAADGEEGRYIPYALLVLTAWRLTITYWLHLVQASSFGLYEYYGGTVRNGVGVVIAGALLGHRVIAPVFDAAPFLRVVLG